MLYYFAPTSQQAAAVVSSANRKFIASLILKARSKSKENVIKVVLSIPLLDMPPNVTSSWAFQGDFLAAFDLLFSFFLYFVSLADTLPSYLAVILRLAVRETRGSYNSTSWYYEHWMNPLTTQNISHSTALCLKPYENHISTLWTSLSARLALICSRKDMFSRTISTSTYCFPCRMCFTAWKKFNTRGKASNEIQRRQWVWVF